VVFRCGPLLSAGNASANLRSFDKLLKWIFGCCFSRRSQRSSASNNYLECGYTTSFSCDSIHFYLTKGKYGDSCVSRDLDETPQCVARGKLNARRPVATLALVRPVRRRLISRPRKAQCFSVAKLISSS